MTLLNWELTPDCVTILSDTLALNSATRDARNFMTKIYPAPHLDMVITGTGIGFIVVDFFAAVNDGMLVENIDEVAALAPDVLRAKWEDAQHFVGPKATVTIYLFGLSPSGVFVGYALRSTQDFVAEPLPHAMGIKPAPDVQDMDGVEDLSGLVDLAFRQQAADRARPRPERIGVGGHIWLYHLSHGPAGGMSLQCTRLIALEHYDDDRATILAQRDADAEA